MFKRNIFTELPPSSYGRLLLKTVYYVTVIEEINPLPSEKHWNRNPLLEYKCKSATVPVCLAEIVIDIQISARCFFLHVY